MGARRSFAGLLAALGAVGSLVVSAVATTAPVGAITSTTFGAPVYAGDFPDPYVVLSGGTYWAYSTGSAGRNLQVMSSSDLQTWTGPVEALSALPGWASAGLTWAPGVIQRSGTFVMYYTVHDRALGKQCISLATAPSAGGPFTDGSSAPLICQANKGGSIDPNPYLDPGTGHLYLLWKSDDNSIGRPTHLWIQRLTSNGLALYPGTTPTLLLTESDAWQSPTVEGPAIVRHAGVYYLFYGANNYATAQSGIGYATSTTLLAPFTNQAVTGPWLGTTGNAQGPQGPCLFVDSAGVKRMAFAAWFGPVGYQNGGVRSLWIGTLAFNSLGVPGLH
jgi:beta-xylosidase